MLMALATQNDWVTVNPTNASEVKSMTIMIWDLCIAFVWDKYKG